MKIKLFISLALILLFLSCSHTSINSFYGEREPAALKSKESCSDLILEIIGEKFSNRRLALEQSLSAKMKEEDKVRVLENLDSLLFIDYPHTLEKLLDESPETYLEDVPLHAIYNRSKGIEFRNYSATMKYLKDIKPEMTLETLKKLHSMLMKDNVDRLDSRLIGEFRESYVGGAVFSEPISKEVFQELESNPYITTTGLAKIGDDQYGGIYSYPSLEENNIKPEILNKIQATHPKLYSDIMQNLNNKVGDGKILQKNLVTALSEDLLAWFVRERDQIGPIKNKIAYKKFVNLVAKFHKEMICIHPFSDGNGRTVRMFALYYPFLREGLPPPRMVDVDADIYSSLESWVKQIEKGVESSVKLYSQIIDRNEHGLSLLNTPELFFPYGPTYAPINFLSQRPKEFIENYKDIQVDPSQFMEYVKQRRLAGTAIQYGLNEKPFVVLSKLAKDYRIFVQKSQMEFVHEKFGKEFLSLQFADLDFKMTFNDKSYKDIAKWKFKMQRWYDDSIIWRGLANQHQIISEEEILSAFTTIHPQMCSNNVLRNMPPDATDDILESLVKEDFEKYNKDLINGGLDKMAQDHSDSGPMYGVSYGYSTSRKREVGKAFAMGAMVIAKYGEHHDLEKQALLKSRVLIGARRSIKDVDLARLKKLRSDFSYHYPRQKEVMGVGAADPDSIMIVQTIDAKGNVIKSYLRNPNSPQEIWVIKGEASTLPSDQSNVLEIIKLDQ